MLGPPPSVRRTQPKAPDAGKALDRLIDVATKIFALVAGATTVVVLAGGAVVGLRLHHVDVPAEAVIGDLPKELLVTTGLVEVILPSVVATAICFFLLPRDFSTILRKGIAILANKDDVRLDDRRLAALAGDRRGKLRTTLASRASTREGLLVGPFALLAVLPSQQGAIGLAGMFLLPLPLVGPTDSAYSALAVAGIIAILLFGWIVYSTTAPAVPRIDRLAATVALSLGLVVLEASLVVLWSPPQHVLTTGLVAGCTAIVFIFSATAIYHEFEDRPWSLGALAATTILACITIAPWFVNYARERPLLPVKVCMASGKPFFGRLVGQTSSRVYVAKEGLRTLQSLPLDSTTAIVVQEHHAPTESHPNTNGEPWVRCPATAVPMAPATTASGTT
jgi:hypothetical protein